MLGGAQQDLVQSLWTMISLLLQYDLPHSGLNLVKSDISNSNTWDTENIKTEPHIIFLLIIDFSLISHRKINYRWHKEPNIACNNFESPCTRKHLK